MPKKLLVVLIIFSLGFAQYRPLGSVAEVDDAGAILANPAGLAVDRHFNSRLLFPVDFTQPDSELTDFSWLMQSRTSGFGFTYRKDDYNLFHFGSGMDLDYGLYFGVMSHFSRRGYEAIDLGLIWRGMKWCSIGSQWDNVYSRTKTVGITRMGIALRPLGDRLTLSYDSRIKETGSEIVDLGGLAGLSMEVFDGLILQSTYDLKSEGWQLGVALSYGLGGLESYASVNESGSLTSDGIIGIFSNVDRKRSLMKAKKPRFVEVRFRYNISDSPGPVAMIGSQVTTLKQTIEMLDQFTRDEDITGLVIYPDEMYMGFSMMMEVREALVRMKAAGKQIFVFSSVMSDGQYALLSLADGIYLNSGGVMFIDGIAMGVDFWKGTFDKVGLKAQYYRRGRYKSAAETYTREGMSDPSREARLEVLNDIDRMYRRMLMDRPGLTRKNLDTIFAKALFTPDQALEIGLIDGTYHPDQIGKIVSDQVGEEINLSKAAFWRNQWDYAWESGLEKRIALIYAEGPILPGRASNSPFDDSKQVGSVTTARAIRKAREDKSIAGIILRINSPGGSILASEDIWREVNRTTHPDSADAENQKPFYVSMGSVAASGGYYIACAADTIVADSACITGSIGVLAGKISGAELLNKIGYNIEVLQSEPHADMFSLHREFSDQEGQRMQALVDNYYDIFLQRVAEGRSLEISAVDSVGQGRIWSGIDAQQIGLVDELGGLEQAFVLMKQRLGIKNDRDVPIKIYPGYDRPEFDFNMKATTTILKELETLDSQLELGKVLDRVALLNSEPALYLMESIIEIE